MADFFLVYEVCVDLLLQFGQETPDNKVILPRQIGHPVKKMIA